ncbi:MAG: ethylbenzene dehydrogenase-related protein [Trueperaceae bacterium]|nr:ethylbenzene dehydrogenase-related protein [Trueperaceae bacterium]
MRKHAPIFFLTLALLMGLTFAQNNVLSVARVNATSLDASAAIWNDAPVLEVATAAAVPGEPAGPVVRLQAVQDGDTIAFRAEWADATESIFKNAWTFDGATFAKSGDEDRLLFTWPIQNNADFASRGCTAACHSSGDDRSTWWMGSDNPSLTYDAWQWKASRTNGAGYVDDKWWGELRDPSDIESSRHGDAKESGGYRTNANEAGDGPAFMGSLGADARYLLASEAVAIDPTLLAAGALIPGYVLERAVGSRGDIDTQGTWEDGTWVVVMRRPLDTGHEDDVRFTVRRRLPFGLAVVDNGGGLKHTIAPEALILDWR